MSHDWNLIWAECLKRRVLQSRQEFLELLYDIDHMGLRSVLELGTCWGGTAAAFLAMGLRVVSVDVNKHPNSDVLSKMYPGMYSFVQADTHDTKSHKNIKDDACGMDVLFIDANHTEESVRDDYANFKDNVARGGLIAFHDISPQNFGVYKLWGELKATHSYKEILVRDKIEKGIGIIYV